MIHKQHKPVNSCGPALVSIAACLFTIANNLLIAKLKISNADVTSTDIMSAREQWPAVTSAGADIY